ASAHELEIVGRLLAALPQAGAYVDPFLAGAARGLEMKTYPVSPSQLQTLRGFYSQPAAMMLGARLHDDQAIGHLQRLLVETRAKEMPRSEMLRTLIEVKPEGIVPQLLELLERGESREQILHGLATFDDEQIPRAILRIYSQLNRVERTAAIDALMARPSSLDVLLNAVAAGTIAKTEINRFQARQIVQSTQGAVREKFELLWGRVNPPSEAVAAQMRQLRATMKPEFLELADRREGRVLFEQRCAACHTLFGKGGRLGPDLTGGGRKELEYLIINVVDPNAAIPADWRLTIATLNDGRVVSGSPRIETDSSLTLLTAEGPVTLERASIAKLERMDTSLMPAGLLDDLAPDRVRDLFAFLMSDDGEKP
ncbi:MAG TPA: c-type cytochrome, partial [Opitutaceae bacterium]|nr:c-type cytochrome [Opitutaceae bacterium]